MAPSMREPGGSIDYQLGQVAEQLRGINRRLDDGSKRHAEIDERLDKLELIEARRTGVIAAIAGAASLVGGALGMIVPSLLRKL